MSAGVCETESVYCFFFRLSYVRGRVHERFFCPEELTHSLRAGILVFFHASNFVVENSRAVFS